MHTMLGMTPPEVVRAATVTAADLLGIARGRLAPGDAADLITLTRDAGEDIRALRNPSMVIKDGVLVEPG
jgi:imidazolonepropionase-like amidohydrolase